MENTSLILFGDFTEKERLLYFSEESLKASGIEFPKDFLSLGGGQERLISDPDLPAETAEEKNTEVPEELENACAAESVESELLTDFKDENINGVSRGDIVEPSANQVSDKIELVDNEVSNLPDSKLSNHSEAEYSSEKEEKDQILTEVDMKLTMNVEVSECPSPVTDSIQSPLPVTCSLTNVVTVGTKTMMTTSTRTVESGHQTSQSSWADLFKTKPSSKPQGPLNPPSSPALPKPPECELNDKDASSRKDQFQHYFLDVLKKTELTNQVPHLQPRGLKNNANWCYINATLQVLIFCPSFYHFLMRFRLKTDRGCSSTPILDALVLFASQFSKMAPHQGGVKPQEGTKRDVVMGMPFEPSYVYDLLTQVKTTLSQQGKQEDAEEFLSCILNGLHEEIVRLGNKQAQDTSSNQSGQQSAVKESGLGEWEQVGPRNKSTVTRKSTMAKSPVADIFGGYLRSSLVQPGMRESASIQPFFSLQLDLRGELTTVQQAFDNFFRVEEVEGFQCDKSKVEVEVSKKWTLDTLPLVMILHLKRFVFNKNGCEKLTKKVSYDSELHVPTDTLSKVLKIRNKNMLTYKLFAITYHHGKNLHGGHYTSDIFHPAVGWLRADDMNVKLIPTKFVFNPLSNRDPYLLYYSRGDISIKDH